MSTTAVSRFRRRRDKAHARRATRPATPYNHGPITSRFRIESALRTSTRNVAWKASSASWASLTRLRQSDSTIGPWRSTRIRNASSPPRSGLSRNRSRSCPSVITPRLPTLTSVSISRHALAVFRGFIIPPVQSAAPTVRASITALYLVRGDGYSSQSLGSGFTTLLARSRRTALQYPERTRSRSLISSTPTHRAARITIALRSRTPVQPLTGNWQPAGQ